MQNLTLIIPAKFEATTLPIVLKEIKKLNLNCKKIVVVPKYDDETQKVLEDSDCEVVIQNGDGFGNALIEGLNRSSTEYSCIFNADGSFDSKYLNEMLSKNKNDSKISNEISRLVNTGLISAYDGKRKKTNNLSFNNEAKRCANFILNKWFKS